MPVAPVIAKKLKAGDSAKAIGMELDRRAHTYVNDVDLSRSHLNWCTEEPLDEAIERRLGELNTRRKIRADQVRAVGFIVSSNDALPDKEAREFLKEAIGWFAARYGAENMLAAAIHMDEGTPHAQFWVMPVIHDEETGYDRLSCKELFSPDRRKRQADGTWKVVGEGTMTKLQREFWEQVAAPWGYDRPLTREQRKQGYRSVEAYKQAVDATRAAKAEVDAAVADAERANNERARAALEALLADNERLDAENARDDALNDRDQAVYERDMARAEAMAAEADAVAARDELATLSAQAEGLRGEVADLAGERDRIAAEIKAAKERAGKRKAAIEAEADKLRGTVSELRADVEGLEARKTALEAAVADSGVDLAQIRADTRKAEHRRSEAVSEAREAEEERDALKGEVADLRGAKSKIEKAIDQLAERFGRLAEAVEVIATALPAKGRRKAAVGKLSALAGNALVAEAVAGFREWWRGRPRDWDADAAAGLGLDVRMDARMEDKWNAMRSDAVQPTRKEVQKLRAEVEGLRGKMPPRPQVGRTVKDGRGRPR